MTATTQDERYPLKFQHVSQLTDQIGHVLKNFNCTDIHTAELQAEEESTKNRAPPVWDRRTHRGPLCLPGEGLKLRGQQHRPWLK